MANDNSNFYLDAELDQAEAGRDTAAKKIDRLFRTAFEDPDRAKQAYETLLIREGVDGTIRKLDGEDLFGRRWHFGPMKGEFLVKGNREVAREALHQLPDVIRTHKALHEICQDLMSAKRDMLDRRDRERIARQSLFDEHAPARGRGRN
ncbi:hypothetical protein [Rhizobium brockwellii]|uniref:hypothetical protein n=1 Tax=Rhizobium brockwellii TaxID=3019932 RepID=UPI00293DB55B|nr:hypothetical protein [Rhizobium brockwellii]MDV4159323.1 hypothetical protein [Rhizobium brockwellii]